MNVDYVFRIFLFFLSTFLITSISNVKSQNLTNFLERAERYKHVNNDSSLIILRDVYKNSINAHDTILLKLLYPLIKAEIRSGEILEAIKHCNSYNDIANNINIPRKKVTGVILTANVYKVAGLISEALSLLNEAEMLIRENNLNDALSILDINYLYGMCYFELGEYKMCDQYLKKAIRNGAKEYPVNTLGPILLRSHVSSNLDSILYLLNKASLITNKYPNTYYEKIAITNKYARINKKLSKLQESRSYYLYAIQLAKKHHFSSFLSELYNNFAYQLMAEHNYDSIPIILDEALTITRDLNNIDIEASLFDTYSDYYTEIENFQSALEFKNASIQKRNDYREKQQINKSLFLATVFETEKKELEILKQEGRANRFRAIFFGTLSALILILGIAFYYRQKSATRKVRLLTAQREKEIETANALIEGQDTERKRLAMDLHDGLGARIGVLRFNLDKALAKNPKHDDIVSDLTNIGNHIRELSHRLLPTKMEEYGLVFSLQSLIESINQSNQVSISIQQNLKNRLPEKLENQVYHLVFEMLNNAMKHSGCQNIFIQLMQHNAILYLSVEDDGKGFTPDIAADGLGLKNIRQRVAYLAGNIEISTELKKGTILMIEIPVESND